MFTLAKQIIEHRIDESIARSLRDLCVSESYLEQQLEVVSEHKPDGLECARAIIAHNIKLAIIRKAMAVQS
jgi:hypothetical protein